MIKTNQQKTAAQDLMKLDWTIYSLIEIDQVLSQI